MKTYDLYGFKKSDIEQARRAIEEILKIRLEPREGLYRGNYYYLDTGEENFVLQENRDPFDKDWLEEKAQGYEVILYVSGATNPEETERLLTEGKDEITLLKRKLLGDKVGI